jgi:diguanylate cyclase (GGDEF)-like protein
MLVVGGVGCLLGAARPLSPHTPVALQLTVAVIGLTSALLLWLLPYRAVVHVNCVLSLSCIALVVSQAATIAGSITASFCFVWITLYAAVYFRRNIARAYATAAATAMGVALLVNPFTGARQTFLMLVFTMTAASEVLAAHVAQLHRTSVTDPLTGTLNREGLTRAADRTFAAARRASSTVAVAAIDLDGFKAINDTGGHLAGDEVLREFASALRAELRTTDVLARTGGDEFVILLPGADSRHIDTLARRLRRRCSVALTYGAVTSYGDEALTDAVARADRVLYRQKALTRARPVPAQRATEPPAAVTT